MDLYLTPLDWIVTIFSIVGSIALGTYLALRMRSGQNSANFFLAGRKMTWPIIGASFFATNIGAEHLVGLSADAYRYGLSAGTIELTGILSKRVTAAGAGVSVLAGTGITCVLMADQLMGVEAGQRFFPWLHTTWTLNYAYRGFWGFLSITAVLFGVSAFTAKTEPDKLQQTTVDWSRRTKAFSGLSDWRLQLAILTILTVAIYACLW